MKRLNSGIDNLDKLIGGGFPQGRTCLISGEAGTGKSILAIQFLLSGLTNGEKAVYICIDEKPEHIINDMKCIGWDLTPYLESGLFQIFDVTTYFSVSYLGDFDGKKVSKAIEDIMSFVKSTGAERLVIDPISPLIFLDKPMPIVVQYIRSLIFNIESYGKCTALLTSYTPTGTDKDSFHGIAEYAVSGIIKLSITNIKGDYIRSCRIKKLRGSKLDLAEHKFEIQENTGLNVLEKLYLF